MKKHGITESFPKLSRFNALLIPPYNPQKIKAYWDIPSARVRTVWEHELGTWHLAAITFKKRKDD